MKHLFKYIIILAIVAGFSLTSCDEFLDQAPAGEETSEYIFEDYLRAARYMDLLYYYTPPLWEAARGFGTYGFIETGTDMARYNASYGTANQSINLGNWRASVASSEISRWGDLYAQIRRAHMFLDNIDLFQNEPTFEGESRKVTMRGEVHFMIGFYYFELLKRYGGVPLVKEVLSLDSDFKIPRASYDDVKEYILDNLDIAYDLVPDEWPTDNYGRVTKAQVMALKSRLLLYAASPLNNPTNDQARWLEAAEASRDLIDYLDENNMHPLFHDYQEIFMRSWSSDVPEIIMPRHRGASTVSFNSNLILYGQGLPHSDFQAYGNTSPTQNFVDRFEVIEYDAGGNPVGSVPFDWNNPDHVANIYDNRDPRFYYTVLYNNQYWIKRNIEVWRDGDNWGKDYNPKNHFYTRTGYYMRKYWPRECQDYSNAGSARVTSFYIRTGEIYLNYAEAMNELYGPETDNLGRASGSKTALDIINRLRDRLVCPASEDISGQSDPYYNVWFERNWNDNFPVLPDGMPHIPTGLSKDDFRERCLNERAIEMAFEQHYWFDALRLKRGEDRIGGTIYGVDVVKDGDNFIYTRKEVEQRVFDPSRMYLYPIPQNDVYIMGIDQNPGW
ncbi:MAG: RagB/SusD family nutrient uptake outer membrane protein [Bacteroidales bacterium]